MGTTPGCAVRASWKLLLLLSSMGSRCTGFRRTRAHWFFCALEHTLNNCGARAELLCSRWNLLGPGIKNLCPLHRRILFQCATREVLNSVLKYSSLVGLKGTYQLNLGNAVTGSILKLINWQTLNLTISPETRYSVDSLDGFLKK